MFSRTESKSLQKSPKDQITELKNEIDTLEKKSCFLHQFKKIADNYKLIAELEKQTPNNTQALFNLAMHLCYLAVYQHLQTKNISQGRPQFWLNKLNGSELSLPNGKNITYQLSENPKEMPILIMESESPKPGM